ncbi:uncharacterized protein LOC131993648 [Centropristis striata]|uniref:uncharacterized protein LOC131993648 n=1 Tax=Centropristis striata TaxID=184440 RepID=UPI0027E012CE|nr:uncharacterized protein LOC131993648 [Centropristis striata]XP_059215622.1 uncharacterized protein LOC131993648 [Centropristis striata]
MSRRHDPSPAQGPSMLQVLLEQPAPPKPGPGNHQERPSKSTAKTPRHMQLPVAQKSLQRQWEEQMMIGEGRPATEDIDESTSSDEEEKEANYALLLQEEGAEALAKMTMAAFSRYLKGRTPEEVANLRKERARIKARINWAAKRDRLEAAAAQKRVWASTRKTLERAWAVEREAMKQEWASERERLLARWRHEMEIRVDKQNLVRRLLRELEIYRRHTRELSPNAPCRVALTRALADMIADEDNLPTHRSPAPSPRSPSPSYSPTTPIRLPSPDEGPGVPILYI